LCFNKNIKLIWSLDTSLDIFGEIETLKDMELPEVLMKIKNHITLHKFKLALKYVLCGRETFKDEPLFQYVVLSNVIFINCNTFI